MEQPPGFVAQRESSGLVCRLRKSLYGLKQSPGAWFEKFSNVVQQFGMTHSEVDHSVFYRHSSAGCIYLVTSKTTPLSTLSEQRSWQTQVSLGD